MTKVSFDLASFLDLSASASPGKAIGITGNGNFGQFLATADFHLNQAPGKPAGAVATTNLSSQNQTESASETEASPSPDPTQDAKSGPKEHADPNDLTALAMVNGIPLLQPLPVATAPSQPAPASELLSQASATPQSSMFSAVNGTAAVFTAEQPSAGNQGAAQNQGLQGVPATVAMTETNPGIPFPAGEANKIAVQASVQEDAVAPALNWPMTSADGTKLPEAAVANFSTIKQSPGMGQFSQLPLPDNGKAVPLTENPAHAEPLPELISAAAVAEIASDDPTSRLTVPTQPIAVPENAKSVPPPGNPGLAERLTELAASGTPTETVSNSSTAQSAAPAQDPPISGSVKPIILTGEQANVKPLTEVYSAKNDIGAIPVANQTTVAPLTTESVLRTGEQTKAMPSQTPVEAISAQLTVKQTAATQQNAVLTTLVTDQDQDQETNPWPGYSRSSKNQGLNAPVWLASGRDGALRTALSSGVSGIPLTMTGSADSSSDADGVVSPWLQAATAFAGSIQQTGPHFKLVSSQGMLDGIGTFAPDSANSLTLPFQQIQNQAELSVAASSTSEVRDSAASAAKSKPATVNLPSGLSGLKNSTDQLAVDPGQLQTGAPGFSAQPIDTKMNSESSTVNRDQLFSQIVDQVKVMTSNGHSQMELSLKPDHLGKLQLHVSLENHLITAKFVAESEQVKQIIETNLVQLRKSLQENGVQVDSLQVTVNQQDGAGAFNHFAQQNGQSSRQFVPGQVKTYRFSEAETMDSGGGQPGISNNSRINLIA